MNYLRIYNNIIYTAQQRILSAETYSENHHIIPKCIGGSESNINKVELLAKEHFICHHVLTKLYPHHRGIILAFWMMCHANSNRMHRDYRITAATYQKYKIIRRQLISGKNHPNYNKRVSTETRQKISKSKKGQILGADARQKISKKLLGIRRSNDTRKLMSIAKTGLIRTAEHKKNLSLARKGQPCPESTKEKLKLIFKNRYFSPETRKKLSDAAKARAMKRRILQTTGILI